ncbi:MAG TPA: LuxR C-terminal-related transcriptional regulator [Tepidisphaeraceae bacterium]|nr:LuxR C-terminal-related transcriptional regulator [Tepidisphaeraceae bacterium]
MSHTELLELTDRLEVLYRSRAFGQLMESGVDLIRPLFDADLFSIGFTDPKRKRHVAIYRPTHVRYSEQSDRYRELAHQSPMLQYWLRTGDHERVLRRSDCCDPVAYRNTAIYSEIDRHFGINQHIGTWLRAGSGRHLEIAMSREGSTDFSDRDVARFGLIRKHFFRAYVNVCDLTRFEMLTRGEIASDLPTDVVELQDTSLVAELDRDHEREKSFSSFSTEPMTPREREVLRWIVEGKTNQEIGIILGISWRTVRIHCERIFRKLNVETRTAAAVRAMEAGFEF